MGKDGPPIDRGWAWVIAGGLFLKSLITGGFIKSYGVFFSAFVETYGRSASETQLIRSARAICATIAGPLGTALSERFTERAVVMSGALLMSLGFILAFFADSLEYLIFTFGICTGLGISLINGPSKVCLGRYFDKKRGRANSLAMVGAAVGQIAVPPLVSLLMGAYSLRGAMLIYGGISLHTVLSGALMRPLSSYGTNKSNQTEVDAVDDKNGGTLGDISLQDESGFHDDIDKQVTLSESAINGVSKSDEKVPMDKGTDRIETPKSPQVLRLRQSSGHSSKATDGLRGSTLSLTDRLKTIGSNLTVNTLPDDESYDLQKIPSVTKSVEKRSVCSTIIGFIKSVFDRRVITNPLYSLFLVCTSLFMITNNNQVTFLVPRAQDIGMSREMAAVVVSIVGGCDVFGRLMLGVLADVQRLPSHRVMALGVALTSLIMFALPSTNSFGEMAVVAVLYGLFGSSHAILNLSVMVDFVGKDLLAKAVGMSILFYGASNAIFAPLLGLVKDKVGTYDAVFYVTASLQLFAAILLASLEPIARKKHKAQLEAKTIDIEKPALI